MRRWLWQISLGLLLCAAGGCADHKKLASARLGITWDMYSDSTGDYDGSFVDPVTGKVVEFHLRGGLEQFRLIVDSVLAVDIPDDYARFFTVDAEHLDAQDPDNPDLLDDPIVAAACAYVESNYEVELRAEQALGAAVGDQSTKDTLLALASRVAPPASRPDDDAVKKWKHDCNNELLDCLDDCGAPPPGKVEKAKWAVCIGKCVKTWWKCKKDCKNQGEM